MPRHATLDETGRIKTEVLPTVVPIFSPPQGMIKIVNMYVDSNTKKLVCQYDDNPTSAGNWVFSNPPPGGCRIVNAYVDPETEKLVVKYDDTPIP